MHARRTQNMPGWSEGNFKTLHRLEFLVVMQRFEVLERFPGILLGKKRLRVLVLGKLLPKRVLGVLFLQETRIWQQHLAQLMGGLGAVNLALESILHQRWQVAGMVNMRKI